VLSRQNDKWRDHRHMCISEASAADIVLVYARQDERQMGALVEMGAAGASGAMVYLVSDHQRSDRHHPRVRCFKLAAAVESIAALSAGERARRFACASPARPSTSAAASRPSTPCWPGPPWALSARRLFAKRSKA
jgi:hypothetical protein